jgi:hypothetical protein
MKPEQSAGFARPWVALTIAFALHVLDEATTGFLKVYNPTVIAVRHHWRWFPMPTFEFRVWLVGLIIAVAFCFALTPLAARGVRWFRPLAWLYAVIQFSNAMGHTIGTILGHTVRSVTFPRPAPGFYSSPLLFIGSIWLIVRLVETARAPVAPPAHGTTA